MVTLTNCTFIGNSAVGTNGAAGRNGSGGGNIGNNGGNGTAGVQALGGAIYNLGGLTIYNSSFFTNSATGGSGGSGGNGGDGTFQGGNGGNGGAGGLGYGGAIYNLGTLRLTNCTFSGNTVSGGTGGSGGTDGAGAFAGNRGPWRRWRQRFRRGRLQRAEPDRRQLHFHRQCRAERQQRRRRHGLFLGQRGEWADRAGQFRRRGLQSKACGCLQTARSANNTVAGGNGGNGGMQCGQRHHRRQRRQWGQRPGRRFVQHRRRRRGELHIFRCAGLLAAPTAWRQRRLPGNGWHSRRRPRRRHCPAGLGTFVLRNTILAATTAGANAYDTSAGRITDGGYNISSDASLNLTGTSLKNTDPQARFTGGQWRPHPNHGASNHQSRH